MESRLFRTRKDKSDSSFLFLYSSKTVSACSGRSPSPDGTLEEQVSNASVCAITGTAIERGPSTDYSLGSNIKPHMVKKKRAVVKKIPPMVNPPDELTMAIHPPMAC